MYIVYIGNNPIMRFGCQYYVLSRNTSPCGCKSLLINTGIKTTDTSWQCNKCGEAYELKSGVLWLPANDFVSIAEWDRMCLLVDMLQT